MYLYLVEKISNSLKIRREHTVLLRVFCKNYYYLFLMRFFNIYLVIKFEQLILLKKAQSAFSLFAKDRKK